MAKKKDTSNIKENKVVQDKKRATRKKKETTVTVEKTKQEQSEKVKASPIRKTINTEKPKTFKEIVSVVDFEDTASKSTTVEDTTSASAAVETEKEQETIKQESPVQDVPTHIGGVKLSERLINLLRRQASNK